ncbi:Lon protease family protein [Nitrosophilus alvini]|uniref:Lon protease family protein n=1 Tax=Nitrosophilus alvini TaxID=2714855 RepID=UPI00190B469D|nr:ATP-binding protein [Nitrosophilus alvini]
MDIKPLGYENIYHGCDPEIFDFETTQEVETLVKVAGQERALEAIDFGIGIDGTGYNLYVMGPTGLGKHEIINRILKSRAKEQKTPEDICYVNNFDTPNKPWAILLPPGMGKEFKKDMKKLVDSLKTVIPAAFESEEYQSKRKIIEDEFRQKNEEAYKILSKEAEALGIALVRTPQGIIFAPRKENGEIMTPEEFQQLPEEIKEDLKKKVEYLQDKLEEIIRQITIWKKEGNEKLKELNKQITNVAAGNLLETLLEKYADFEKVCKYLKRVEKDVIENVSDFLFKEDLYPPVPYLPIFKPSFKRYEVNLLVGHKEDEGVPVIYEDHPTYENIVGRIEHIAQMGMLITDFTLIKPGALHKALGGYLIIDARKILTNYFAWDSLKRALFAKKIKIVPGEKMIGLISTLTLEPEPIELNIKIVLVGERILYYLLYDLDPDFRELFKVIADFDEVIHKDENNLQLYAKIIAALAKKEKILPLTRKAVAKTIDISSRMAEDSKKLSMEIKPLTSLLKEADYIARKKGSDTIDSEDIKEAVKSQKKRAARLKERVYEEIGRDTIHIKTTGEKTGQINGLSVIELGTASFGRPVRITAVTRFGKGEVVDIQREVKLGDPIHSKGVMTLAGFLKGRYVPDIPLSLSASLVFEQTYSSVEGDSASLAETCALLSSLSNLPIKQNIAVTGSISQKGEVQAVGGVNHKIEGFFEVCKLKGFEKEQGVIIPKSNIDHLMLDDDVLDAIKKGKFFIYAVESVDEAMEILTGKEAGERDAEGKFPKDSVNRLVEERLVEFFEKAKKIMKEERKKSTS